MDHLTFMIPRAVRLGIAVVTTVWTIAFIAPAVMELQQSLNNKTGGIFFILIY